MMRLTPFAPGCRKFPGRWIFGKLYANLLAQKRVGFEMMVGREEFFGIGSRQAHVIPLPHL
jgi:hypothetical protein